MIGDGHKKYDHDHDNAEFELEACSVSLHFLTVTCTPAECRQMSARREIFDVNQSRQSSNSST